MPRIVTIAIILAVAALGVLYTHDTTEAGATITVNSTSDLTDLNCLPLATGNCTLREALLGAGDHDTIVFDIPAGAPGCTGSGVCTITPTSELPDLEGNHITIDGYTQSGAFRNSQDVGTNAILKIQIDAGNVEYGLRVKGTVMEIAGLAIYNINGSSIEPRFGIMLFDGSENARIEGNYLGLTAAGANGGNGSTGSYGIFGRNSAAAIVGGASVGDRNVISALDGGILNFFSDHWNILGNYIGINPAGTAAIPNATGIRVNNTLNTSIGDPSSIAGRNVISGNGIGIQLDDTIGDIVEGNFIGLRPSGASAIPNTLGGINLSGVLSSAIGGLDAGNIISGNFFFGLRVGDESAGIFVLGNRIGTNPAGTAAVPNSDAGILVDDSIDVFIGATDPAASNLISGNAGGGIRVLNGSANVTVQGNKIGTNLAGTGALGNVGGIDVDLSDNVTIGGSQNAARNIISNNNNHGVFIGEDSHDAVISRNYIGTNAAGTVAMGNGDEGVVTFGDNTQVLLNIIADNGSDGMLIQGPGTVVQGNIIGLGQNLSAMGNAGNGITVREFGSGQIENIPSGPPNVIAHNGKNGISVTGTIAPFGAVTINRNSIFLNDLLGINLGQESATGANEVTPNDNDDVDPGPNNLQNYPTLTYADSGSTRIRGTINSVPTGQFLVEFFNVANCDDSGFGEGALYIGSVTFPEDADGNVDFDVETAYTAPVGSFITSTLTGLTGEVTSEFSNCIQVVARPTPGPTPTGGVTPTPTPIAVVTPPPSAEVTDAPTATPSPTPTATPIATPSPTEASETPTPSGVTDTPTPTGSGGTPTPSFIETPSPTATPVPTPTPSGAPTLTQGDVDCSGTVTARDALLLVGNASSVPLAQFPPCPALTDRTPQFADLDCDGDIDLDDALAVLLFLLDLDVPQEPGCVEIGDPLTA